MATSVKECMTNVAGFRGIARSRDIGEKRQAQEALRQSQEELSDSFEQSPLPLFWITPRGRIRRANRAGLALLLRCSKSKWLAQVGLRQRK